jgi:NodT family efflux transporter outer membrane factor (OMF) lipoprotein
MKKLAYTILSTAYLASCTSLPPSVAEREVRQSLSMPDEWRSAQQLQSSIISSLNELFADDALDVLVGQIMDNNLDIKRAFYQVNETMFATRSGYADLYPKVSANLNSSRYKGAGEVGGEHSASLDVSWEVDLWGKIRDQNQALASNEQARIENYRALQDSLASQGVQAWFDVVSYHQQVQLTGQQIVVLEKRALYSQRQYRSGLGQYDDLVAIERDLAVTESNLQTNIATRNEAIRALQVLTGQYPSGAMEIDYQLPTLTKVPDTSTPLDILTERPDLRSAWQDVLSADASVKVAHKQLYPSLTLSAAFGQGAASLSDISNGNVIWSLVSGLSMPLFNSGQLTNEMYEAQSQAEQVWFAYLIAAQQAFSEVEQALDRERIFAKREQALTQASSQAQKTEAITATRYQKGLVSILEYLDAQDTLFNIQSELITARNNRLKNRVFLALSLGKGV